MHADRLHTGKQQKVPNLPEKMDSASPNDAGRRCEERVLQMPQDILDFYTYLENANKPE